MKTILALLPAVALLAGCPSFTTMGTARTVPMGKTQAYVAPGGVQLRDWQTDDGTATASLETLTLPQFELGARHGITDTVEIGGKIWFLGAEVNSKFQLHRSASADSGLDLALAPAISVYPFSTEDAAGDNVTAIFAWVHVPLLVGVNVSGGSQLVLGPRLSGSIAAVEGETASVFWAGGSLGFAWKLSPTFRLLPEVSVAYPVAVSRGLEATTDLRFEGAIIQGSLGLLFGG